MKVLDVYIAKAREQLPICEEWHNDFYEVPLIMYDGRGLSGYIDIRMKFCKQKVRTVPVGQVIEFWQYIPNQQRDNRVVEFFDQEVQDL